MLSGQEKDADTSRISLLFIGDLMGHDEQIWSAENRETGEYNYDDVFQYVKDLISEADIAIANLEVTLAGPPYRGYPAFSSPSSMAAACKKAGIDIFVTANNHAADRGKKGITNTLMRLDSLNIPHTGTFTDSISREKIYPLIAEKNGFSIAILNYTYGTNGVKVNPPVIVNMIDKKIITEDIKEAESKNPDIIVLFLHWGTEYDTIPSKDQTELSDYFFSQGVDLIIGSHPHVLQKMVRTRDNDMNKERIVVYSLGNFVSNQRKTRTDGGAAVRIEFSKKADSIYVSEAGYYLTWVYTPIEKYRKKFFILPCSEFENRPDFFTKPDHFREMKSFIRTSRYLLGTQNENMPEIGFRNPGGIH
jgi:poly-gamma-glutamate synthesis protein (capsule biosynthesis protein)